MGMRPFPRLAGEQNSGPYDALISGQSLKQPGRGGKEAGGDLKCRRNVIARKECERTRRVPRSTPLAPEAGQRTRGAGAHPLAVYMVPG